MLDLGASINFMQASLYDTLNLGPLPESHILIQLADRSCVHLLGVVDDVLVNVGDLAFPADFYILEMEHDNDFVPITLGRPFLKTTSTKINVST